MAEGLTVRYPGGTTALTDLHLRVPYRGITCLLGANGAGKTTLLETASGLRRPSAGSLTVLGTVPGSNANRSHLGVMLQDGGLPGTARPVDFLRFIASLYPNPRPVADLMELVDIADCARTPIRRLSGGQAARVAWAAAMIGNPQALILDEPTSALDPNARSRMHQVLRQEGSAGSPILVSTHLIEDVVHLADYVVVLRSGTVALAGSPEDLRPRNRIDLRGPRHLAVSSLLDALPVGSYCEEVEPGMYRVEVEGSVDPSVVATVTSWCAQHNVAPDIAIADLGSVLRDAIGGMRGGGADSE